MRPVGRAWRAAEVAHAMTMPRQATGRWRCRAMPGQPTAGSRAVSMQLAVRGQLRSRAFAAAAFIVCRALASPERGANNQPLMRASGMRSGQERRQVAHARVPFPTACNRCIVIRRRVCKPVRTASRTVGEAAVLLAQFCAIRLVQCRKRVARKRCVDSLRAASSCRVRCMRRVSCASLPTRMRAGVLAENSLFSALFQSRSLRCVDDMTQTQRAGAGWRARTCDRCPGGRRRKTLRGC